MSTSSSEIPEPYPDYMEPDGDGDDTSSTSFNFTDVSKHEQIR